MKPHVVILALALGACAPARPAAPPRSPQQPAEFVSSSERKNGAFQAMARCVQGALSGRFAPIVREAFESVPAVQLSYAVGDATIWSLGFVDAGGGVTHVEYRTAPGVGRDALSTAVAACAGRT